MITTYSIEPATWRDLNPVRKVEEICFPKDMWPLWDMIGVLTLPNIIRLKAVRMGKVVGFVAGDIRRHDEISWIATIAVLPDYRRQGIGRALLAACEKLLPTPAVRLCVRSSNREAIQMYLSHGYYQLEIWDKYYLDGEAAIVMEKMR